MSFVYDSLAEVSAIGGISTALLPQGAERRKQGTSIACRPPPKGMLRLAIRGQICATNMFIIPSDKPRAFGLRWFIRRSPNGRLISSPTAAELSARRLNGRGRNGVGQWRDRTSAVERRRPAQGQLGAEAVGIFAPRARSPVPALRRWAVRGSGEAASTAAGQPARRADA